MSFKSTAVAYGQSLFAIALSMAVILFVLNWLHTRGPSFLQGPAGNAGAAVTGSRYNF
jgi:hypothetical protein